VTDRPRQSLAQTYCFNSGEYFTHNSPTGKAQIYSSGIGGVAHAVLNNSYSLCWNTWHKHAFAKPFGTSKSLRVFKQDFSLSHDFNLCRCHPAR